MEDRYQATLDKKELIERRGINYTEVWSCELDQLLATDGVMRDFFKQHKDHKEPLNPRETLYGGRTCPNTLYYKPKEGEELKYVDVCS